MKSNLILVRSDSLRIAAAYIRCSTDRQEDSPHVQRAILEEYARQQGFVIPPDLWFVDEDVSGGKAMRRRPAGAKLLTMATDRKRRAFGHVLIVRPDRAFRDHVDQEESLGLMLKSGCEVLAARADMSHATAMQRAMLRVQAVFAQAERELTGERIKEHNMDRHHKGLHTHGRPSFGLRVGESSKDPLRIVEGELPRAIRVFELYAHTCGNSRETARILNREGIRPRSGKAWTGSMVRKTVMGPQYRRMQTYDGDLRPKLELIPETIPADLLERVDLILSAQYGHWFRGTEGRRMGPNTQATYSGLLRCGNCGSALDSNIRPGNESPRFCCRSKEKAEGACHGGSFHAPTIDYLIGIAIKDALTARADMGPTQEQKRRTVKVAADPRAQLEAQRARARELLVRGVLREKDWQEECERIDQEMAQLPAVVAPAVAPRLNAKNIADLLEVWPTLWGEEANLHSMTKRELLMAGFGVTPRGITLTKVKTAKYERGTARLIVEIAAPRLQDDPVRIEHEGAFNYAISRGRLPLVKTT